MFGVETALWPTSAKKAGKWYRGVLEAAERFMVRYEDEAQLSRQRCATAVSGAQGSGGRATGGVEGNPTKGMRVGGATGAVEGKLRWTKVGRRRQTG